MAQVLVFRQDSEFEPLHRLNVFLGDIPIDNSYVEFRDDINAAGYGRADVLDAEHVPVNPPHVPLRLMLAVLRLLPQLPVLSSLLVFLV